MNELIRSIDKQRSRPSHLPPSLREFFVLNAVVALVAISPFVVGFAREQPRQYLQVPLLAICIIGLQYRPLCACTGPLGRAFVFYISMLLFLFLWGVLTSWDMKVGSNAAGSWLARFDGGVRFLVLGQLFGGLLGYVFVLFMNHLLGWPPGRRRPCQSKQQ